MISTRGQLAGFAVCIPVVFPVAPVIFDPFVIFLVPPVLVILVCAFAMWTVYKATDVNAAANSTAIVIPNNIFLYIEPFIIHNNI
jgi:hypothetical protein